MKVVSASSNNLLEMKRLNSREVLLTWNCVMGFSELTCSKWSAEWINELIWIKKFQSGPCYSCTRLKGFQHCLLFVKGSLFVFAVSEGNSDGYEPVRNSVVQAPNILFTKYLSHFQKLS